MAVPVIPEDSNDFITQCGTFFWLDIPEHIENFFRHRIDYAFTEKCNGCLLVTTVIEREQVEEMVLDRVQHHWTLQKADFELCLTAAQEQGEVPKDKNTRDLANCLFCLLIGMVVMMKGGAGREPVERMVDMAMASVKN